jgi:hypothetical protein
MNARPAEIVVPWRGLPVPGDDGRPASAPCTVLFTEGALKHLVERHVMTAEGPWDDWLPAPLRESLTALVQGRPDEVTRRETVRRAASLFEDEARHSLARPLVLAYLCREPWEPPDPGRGVEHWALVTPRGAAIIVRCQGERRVLTCFFPDDTGRAPRGAPRWQVAVDALVRRYATWEPGVGWVPPDHEKEYRVHDPDTRRPTEFRYRFRYVTPESWGFSDDPDAPGWDLARLGPWDAAPGPEPVGSPATPYVLKPRAPIREGTGHV